MSPRSCHSLPWILALTLAHPFALHAEDPLPDVARLKSSPVLQSLVPNPLSAPPRSPAESALAQMYLPPGFRAELIAAEPDVRQPIAFAFDDRGRLWIAEAHSYPKKREPGEGLDTILILEDADGDGRFESRKVFAEGLNLVSGLEVGHGGLWVGAAPELLFIPDLDRDDRPDGPPRVLLDGFGYQDTHECLNSFHWGPDGWLYGNQGVFNFAKIGKPGEPDDRRVELRAGVWRYHPVRHEFEVFAYGGSNQWGLDHDERGQLFMTHCRSYWGRGLTTHVIQGGHYWNQANANHAPYIIGRPPDDYPDFRNYLLASARYGHGAGGAGPRGSDAIYGGHSHVGTMIYHGDNWPEAYRGHLFTLNLHGHQINHQINHPLGSGFDTVHAGQDVFFCSDPTFVGVDLQYGPDGAVYVIDWQDAQHCHNPNTERWDRSNGRVYRIQFEAAYRPRQVNLGAMSDLELVELLRHPNRWHGRTAQRLLQERAAQSQGVDAGAIQALDALSRNQDDPALRLRAFWALQVVHQFTNARARRALDDPDPYVRGWAVQLAADDRRVSRGLVNRFVRLAQDDSSPVVRRFLASAVQRVLDRPAWRLIEALAAHAEDREDRNIPYLLWTGLAQRMASDPDRAFELAQSAPIPLLADWTHWYGATLNDRTLDRVVADLAGVDGEVLRRRLSGLELAMRPRANVTQPKSWSAVAPSLVASTDPRVARQARRLAAAFGDTSVFPELRNTLADRSANLEARREAFAALSRAQDPGSLEVFLGLMDEPDFVGPVIPVLARYDSPQVPAALLQRYAALPTADRAAVLVALTGRPSHALALLDAADNGTIARDQLTAYHIRQLTGLNHPEIHRRVEASWGRIHQSPAEKEALMKRLETVYGEAPLWAYSAREGQRHYETLCVVCHGAGTGDAKPPLGPNLTGSGRNGVRYFLENIIDPNAVIGSDFQMTTVETRDGELISGLLVSETDSALVLRATTGESVIPKASIARLETKETSLMPEGLLESLNDREQIELLKFLGSL